jgi:hypothetical protein
MKFSALATKLAFPGIFGVLLIIVASAANPSIEVAEIGLIFGDAVDKTPVNTTAIPEPATALLGGIGVLLLLRRRK